MRTNIKATGVELTAALKAYVDDKMSMLDKFVGGYEDVYADVEIGKRTKHHKTGDWFFAEANLYLSGRAARQVNEEADLYAAIDKMKDGLAALVRNREKRKNTLFRRGARRIKNFFRPGD
ncbi:MAG: ribosomal subunit interface protein [Candidatus Vogelbacteria bacterium CG10_big_fil_rev_8_21_14_0_10_49_38]|uniref:Ribosomal subunit interface protein n=1 Tax=Candidatus Vogelbacteria bacterium CG10_big_fil_rev_8_21_14_0_10_49_38 TaxID=1975043 RepID=A0A2H0RJT0_9BACT|nr:MAG: ribosomal subunit interface protein [bacterium CG10_49_38]PIR46035.1 MAG: ribosomal subunit interface protein [Candidatus Vogelbacteria bacterium CG10_big_fil_rev_8_21_14_0_10_49_38]